MDGNWQFLSVSVD